MVKCVDCGFLTLRDMHSGKLVEAMDDYRISGRVPPIVAFEAVHNYPICFAMAWESLFPEMQQAAEQQFLDKSDDWGKYCLTIIGKDRKCDNFTKWQQGFTPKEHKEMMDRQEFLNWQARQRKEDKRWRVIELIVIGVITVVIAGGFTILGAFIERGSLFP